MTHKLLRCGDDTRERESMQQILKIDRKNGAAADHTTIIIHYLSCRHANPSIYGMSDSTALARLTETLLTSPPFRFNSAARILCSSRVIRFARTL